MLVLTRKSQEQIRVGDEIVVTVLRVKGNSVRIGIDAPKNVRVVRGELPPKEGCVAMDAGGGEADRLATAVRSCEGESADRETSSREEDLETAPKRRTLKDYVTAFAL